MEANKKWDLTALASIPLIMTLGGSMLIPILPTIEKEINITKFQSSLILTIYSFASILLVPVAGYLSDKLGRKKIIIPSLIITGIGGIVSGLAAWLIPNPFWVIIIGRLIQGIGASGAFPVVIPTVGDMFKEETDVSKGLGIIETSNTFGKVVSPILGAALAALLWFIPFFAISFFAIISILLVIFLVKTPSKEEEEKKDNFKVFVKKIKDLLKKEGRWLSGIFIGGLITTFILFGLLFFFSSILEDNHGIEGIPRGLIVAVPLLTLCITSFVIGKIIGKKKFLMKWIIVAGNTLTIASLIILSFWDNLVFLTTILSFAGIGIGAILPCLDALVTEGVEKLHRGTITALYSSMRLLGVAIGPPIAALLLKSGTMAVFYTLAGAGLAAIILTLLLIRPKKNHPKPA
ncbi:MFS transporter [Herbivorax sp. ANBcel31]|uniref:MFS transporter n=1 Tax=Herbivorax sp. ANBcel31 TaxID=3069754 RepID=UPI0027B85686|nr:MFS transporter [Herbivorax sp. ANBcel31]MDQ2086859.1 MFS transporter [Herbivorax sp. ANBcel31]